MRSRLVIITTLVVQVILLSITFPISELWTGVPLLYNDHAYHLYQMKLARAFRDTWTLVGYDPTFAAGYPGGIVYNPSGKLPWLLAAAFHGVVEDIVLYKVYVFLCGVLAPVCIPIALRRLGADRASMALGAGLAVALWWVSWFRWMFTEGMVSFVTSSYLAVLYLVEVIRFLEGQGRIRTIVALGVAGAGLFFFHPLFVVAVTIGTLITLVLLWCHVPVRNLLLLALVVPIVSLLPNTPWLIAMHQYAAPFHVYFIAVDANMPWKELVGVYHGHLHGSKTYPVILWLAIATLLFSQRPAERRRMAIFAVAGFALIWFAALGAAVPLFHNLDPNRFGPVGYLFLIVPAAFSLSAVRSGHSGVSKMLAFWARISLVPVAAVAAFCLYETVIEVYGGHYGQPPPQVRPLSERVQCVTRWLESDTNREGRVLFETFRGQGEESEAAYYAYKTEREFIGGPQAGLFLTGFVNGKLFGQQIESLGEERVMKYLDLYNIGWIVARNRRTKRILDSLRPRVIEVGTCDNVTMYRTERPKSYFLEGRGVVAVDGFNNLILDGLEGNLIVLKYTFMRHLTSTPRAKIEPFAPLNDMPAFIRIVNPPRTLRLYLER